MIGSSPAAKLNGRRILLGVCGGIAAYKAAELIRLLKKAGSDVQVLMTRNAERFVSRLTLGTLSEHEVLIELFPEKEEGSWTRHITLGHWADLFVIAPATAETIAKLAQGHADSMLTATALAAKCPVLLCPAMDHDMYVHPATHANLERLRSFGHEIMEPDHGELASGLIGHGRLPEPEGILERIAGVIHGRSHQQQGQLSGVRVLVTAGPTREHFDPVRFVTNRSSGKMGFAVAEAAARRGADVTLISGPSNLVTPEGVRRIDIETADEMFREVMRNADDDLIVMAAAVSDYAPAERSDRKIKKAGGEITIQMKRTIDILRELGERRREGQILVGFAMETDNPLENAREKLSAKRLDWIVLNRLDEEGAGFGTDTNRITLLGRDGTEESLPLMSKRSVAEAILNRVAVSLPRTAA